MICVAKEVLLPFQCVFQCFSRRILPRVRWIRQLRSSSQLLVCVSFRPSAVRSFGMVSIPSPRALRSLPFDVVSASFISLSLPLSRVVSFGWLTFRSPLPPLPRLARAIPRRMGWTLAVPFLLVFLHAFLPSRLHGWMLVLSIDVRVVDKVTAIVATLHVPNPIWVRFVRPTLHPTVDPPGVPSLPLG